MLKDKNGCYIIAEIGGNFRDIDTAFRLIDDAKACGVDAVKLQTYKAETIVSDDAVFDMENISGVLQKDYFKKFEIDERMHEEIYKYANDRELDIFSTPSHYTDVEMLERVGTDIYKIGADDATNLYFLKRIAALGKPIMLSTGMCTLEEVKEAVNAILETGNSNIIIMHTISLYPTKSEEVHLNVLKTLQKEFPQFTIGYSDHTLGVEACLYAAVMGAKVIEKHFTYDKGADGPDHMHSANKEEMTWLVNAIRQYEVMSGSAIKKPINDEIINRKNNRKSIIAICDIRKGERFTESNIDVKRPGNGISPKYYDQVLGIEAAKDIKKNTILDWADIGIIGI